jgi:hypothetical protein
MQALSNKERRLNTEWRTWIRENLQKGSPWQSIVAFMLQNEFDPAYAMTAVQILKDEMKSDYRYDETPVFL